ncbi:MAG: glycosyltransferase family 2 protein [Pyrinomonadaceae bacterium]
MSDTFSVAMCTYNGARYLAAQLASLSAQTHLPGELVVCDDRSEDETREIVQDFSARAPFCVRLHVNGRCLGSTKNFERAISLCTGDLIALSDQDDVWLPQKLERLAAYFAAQPCTGMVFSDAEVVDENLRSTGRSLWNLVGFADAEQRLIRCGRALDVLLPGWTVTGATMAFRATFKGLVLEIPDDLPVIHDGWIGAVVAAVAGVEFITEPLIKYRQHPRQQIGAPPRGAAEMTRQSGLRSVVSAAHRSNDYERLIKIAERISLRLSERKDFSDSDGARSQLDALVGHLRTRADLPESRLRRAPYVLRELLSHRYHLYSKGTRSAVKDLLA